MNYNKEDLKLIEESAKRIISDFKIEITKLDKINKNTLETIINYLIKKNVF